MMNMRDMLQALVLSPEEMRVLNSTGKALSVAQLRLNAAMTEYQACAMEAGRDLEASHDKAVKCFEDYLMAYQAQIRAEMTPSNPPPGPVA